MVDKAKPKLSDRFNDLDAAVDHAQEKFGAWQDLEAKADAAKADYDTATGIVRAMQSEIGERIANVFPTPAVINPRVRQS